VSNPSGTDLSPDGAGPSSAPSAPTRVLVVDDDEAVRDVIGTLLGEEGYLCSSATGAEEALALCKAQEFHLVLSDMKMPGRDGLWLLERLRNDFPTTAVIMLTAIGDTELAVDCLRRGAADYLLKPPRLTDLVRAIERALARRRLELARHRYRTSLESRVREKTAELQSALREVEQSYQSTLHALVQALDAREHETSDHSQRVVRYTLAIARRLGISEKELPDIGRGALMHDIGKIGVPDAILLKPDKLTPEEWTEMRKHPQIGHSILRSIDFLQVPAEIVLCHQERFDGRGYPRGLAGDAIPIGSRIFAIADAFDAMTNDRPYRKGGGVDAARAEIARYAGTQFDPRSAEAFLSMSDREIIDVARPGLKPPV